ncbi:hypothetical protein X975_25838, partial [Stegodyphus mimosarum]
MVMIENLFYYDLLDLGKMLGPSHGIQYLSNEHTTIQHSQFFLFLQSVLHEVILLQHPQLHNLQELCIDL